MDYLVKVLMLHPGENKYMRIIPVRINLRKGVEEALAGVPNNQYDIEKIISTIDTKSDEQEALILIRRDKLFHPGIEGAKSTPAEALASIVVTAVFRVIRDDYLIEGNCMIDFRTIEKQKPRQTIS